MKRLLATAGVLLALHVAEAAAQERRVALVIGNGAYQGARLANPVNDSADMARALSDAGFEVILRQNVGARQMRQAIREFGAALKRADVGLFYFAGHGLQVRGNNFLVPVDADIRSEADAEDLAIDASYALRTMDEAQVKVSIVILDACRNNPYARGFRSASHGLAQMSAAVGTVIAFSTAPGTIAADGDGRNGTYTRHLLANIATPGSELLRVFQRTRAAVVKETGGRQVPWESTSLIGDFYFKAPTGAPSAMAAPTPAWKPAATERVAPVPMGRCFIKPLWFKDGTTACLEQFEIFHQKRGGITAVEQFRGKKTIAYAIAAAGMNCQPAHAWYWDDPAGREDERAVNLCERYAKKPGYPESCSCELIAPASGNVPLSQQDFVTLMFRNYYEILAREKERLPQFATEIDRTRIELEGIERSHGWRIDGELHRKR